MAETKPDIQDIRLMLEKIESIIDSRLIGLVEPGQDELSEIREYEKGKTGNSLELNEL
jgi:hypothetical protein